MSNIDLHVHLDLYQFVYISEGRSTLISSSGKYNFGSSSLVMIPPKVDHGFYSYSETSTFGHVITISDAYFDRIAHRGVLASDLVKSITIIEKIERDRNPEILSAIERVVYEHSFDVYPYILSREASVLTFIVEFLRIVAERNALHFGVRTSDIGDPTGKSKIEILSELIDRYYKDQKNVQFYADRMNMSMSNLNKFAVRATGKTVHSNIKARNLEKARSYLINTNLSVKEISFTLGYEDAAYFTRFFTANTGLSPIAFRRLSTKALVDEQAVPVDQT